MTMAARRKTAVTTDAEALRNLEHTVGALVGQLALAMETLTVMRAEQMRLMEKLGLQDQGHAPHRCTDPEHRETKRQKAKTVELKARKGRTGGRRG